MMYDADLLLINPRRPQVSHEPRLPVAATPAQLAPAGARALRGAAAGPLGVEGGASATSDARVALLTALPFGLAAAWMLLLARHSQATGKPPQPVATALTRHPHRQ